MILHDDNKNCGAKVQISGQKTKRKTRFVFKTLNNYNQKPILNTLFSILN